MRPCGQAAPLPGVQNAQLSGIPSVSAAESHRLGHRYPLSMLPGPDSLPPSCSSCDYRTTGRDRDLAWRATGSRQASPKHKCQGVGIQRSVLVCLWPEEAKPPTHQEGKGQTVQVGRTSTQLEGYWEVPPQEPQGDARKLQHASHCPCIPEGCGTTDAEHLGGNAELPWRLPVVCTLPQGNSANTQATSPKGPNGAPSWESIPGRGYMSHGCLNREQSCRTTLPGHSQTCCIPFMCSSIPEALSQHKK